MNSKGLAIPLLGSFAQVLFLVAPVRHEHPQHEGKDEKGVESKRCTNVSKADHNDLLEIVLVDVVLEGKIVAFILGNADFSPCIR